MDKERYIVAVDLGSSKISLCVADVDGGNADMLYYKEVPSEGIARSSVQNVRHAGEVLKKLVADAENELGIKITQAVTGLPKYYIRQESAQEKRDRSDDDEINEEEIKGLMEIAKSNIGIDDESGETIYGAVAQSYSDGEDFQVTEHDIIGRFSKVLEGNFKIFIGKKSYVSNIDKVFNAAGISAIRKYFTADTTAKAVLDYSEMENGVALIDFGGGAVSVSVYQKGIMRHYAAIPFGGRSITSDINKECAISERLAENIKKGYGVSGIENLQNLSEKELQIQSGSADPDKRIAVKYICEIVTARMNEIAQAILYEIEKSGFADMLRSGLVITGGGVELCGCCNTFQNLSGYSARVGYPKAKFRASSCNGIRNTSAAVCAGLILEASSEHKLDCAQPGEFIPKAPEVKIEEPVEEKPAENLFGEPVNVEKKPEKKRSGGLFGRKKKVKEEEDEGPSLWDHVSSMIGDIMDPDKEEEN